ncbi:MAG: ribonuclease HI family protein [Microgenomates group bacterium]|nr:ribonuclease HI family protein [Microgenomates group bacterium]
MILKIYTDGGAKGNPGPASIGMVFYLEEKKIFSYREDIGIKTNNEAEYQAVITALEKIKNLGQRPIVPWTKISKIELYSDSSLLVNQLNGLFKVKNAKIREFIFKIRILEQEINIPISYHLIPREKNKVADDLVNNRV